MRAVDLNQRFWKGKVALYLFFEGGGAACYFVATLMRISGERLEGLFKLGTFVGALLVIIGAFFLWLDLGRKERFFKAAKNLSTSWIARGVLAVGCFLASVALYFIVRRWCPNLGLVKVIWSGFNAGLALAILIYPAMLFMSCKPFRIWNNPMLILLFAALSFLSGEGVFLLISAISYSQQNVNGELLSLLHFLLALSASLIVGTSAIFSMYLLSIGLSSESGKTFLIRVTQGKLGFYLVVAVTLGTLIPLVLISIGLSSKAVNVVKLVSLMNGVLLLVSSFLVRYLLVVGPTRENPVLPGMM